MGLKILFIDNFDSFTYNLVDEFEKRDCEVVVYRNNITLENLEVLMTKINPGLIVISPGPSSPKDAGICIDLIKNYQGKVPILGVCLGHQCMIEALGGVVDRAINTVHGKADLITHDKKTIFAGLESPLLAGRYHSLAGKVIPDCFEVSARASDNEVMAIRHKVYFLEGVQFHPESIMTTLGGKIIENVIDLCKKKNNLKQLK